MLIYQRVFGGIAWYATIDKTSRRNSSGLLHIRIHTGAWQNRQLERIPITGDVPNKIVFFED
jgi:hypothetical protein